VEELEIVKKLLVSRYEETVKKLKKKKENEIWVSELCQCKAKSEFRRDLWFMETDAPSLILGELIHRGLQGFLVSTFGTAIEVEVGKEFNGKVIKGRIDALTRLKKRVAAATPRDASATIHVDDGKGTWQNNLCYSRRYF